VQVYYKAIAVPKKKEPPDITKACADLASAPVAAGWNLWGLVKHLDVYFKVCSFIIFFFGGGCGSVGGVG
jgi:hypothetical protein